MTDQVVSVGEVVLNRRGQNIEGSLLLSKHHMVFSFRPSSSPQKREIWICYPIIDKLSKCRGSSWTSPSTSSFGIESRYSGNRAYNTSEQYSTSHIRVECKDFTYYAFNFTNDGICTETFARISKLATAARVRGSKRDLYAFEYRPNSMEVSLDGNGWDLYNPKIEFERQKLLVDHGTKDSPWRLTKINNEFKLCQSYPRDLIVPSSISDSILQHAAKFRSKQRIPAVVYKHRLGENGNVIARCSQPLVGLNFQNRSAQDEKLVEEIFRTQEREINSRLGSKHGEQPQKNLIVDLRPITNAVAQHALGAGTENVENYRAKKSKEDSTDGKLRSTQNVDKIFCNIDNIHVMRDSLDKLVSTLSGLEKSVTVDGTGIHSLPFFQQSLSKTQWLHRLSIILQSVDRIVKSVHLNNTNVLIHCSDGWDRTSQVSALSQLCLDSYFRSMKGFMVLIEKEWVSFGFKFATRADHGNCIGAAIMDCDDKKKDSFADSDEPFSQSMTSSRTSAGIPSATASVTAFISKAASHIKKRASAAASASALERDGDGFEGSSGSLYSGSSEKSPIFHQFLDCVYQIVRQHPNQFEFNSRFLKRLFYHHYSCQYGTFLCDSEYEAQMFNLKEETTSAWDYFLSRPNEFVNPNYEANDQSVVFFNFTEVKWWFELYGRTDEEMNGLSNSLDRKFAQLQLKTSQTPTTPTLAPT